MTETNSKDHGHSTERAMQQFNKPTKAIYHTTKYNKSYNRFLLQNPEQFTLNGSTDLTVSVTSKHTWWSPSVAGVTDRTDVRQPGGEVVGTRGEVDVCMSGVCTPAVT